MALNRFKEKRYPSYEVGDIGPGGGIIAAIPNGINNPTGQYFERAFPLSETSPTDIGLPYALVSDKDEISKDNSINGKINTLKIISRYDNTVPYAALNCAQYATTHDDWFLPSYYESTYYGLRGLGETHFTSSTVDKPRTDYDLTSNPLENGIVYNFVKFTQSGVVKFFVTLDNGSAMKGSIINSMSGATTAVTLPIADIPRVAFGNNTLIVAGSNAIGSADIIKSTDYGITWSNSRIRTSEYNVSGFRNIKFDNGIFIAAGPGVDPNSPPNIIFKIFRSTDNGTSWTSCSITNNEDIGSEVGDISYGNGIWIITLTNGKIAKSNDNGVTWQIQTIGSYSPYTSATYGDGKWVIGGYGILTSTDNATTWTLDTTPYTALGDSRITNIHYNNQTKKWYVTRTENATVNFAHNVFETSDFITFNKIISYDNVSTTDTYIVGSSTSSVPIKDTIVDGEYIAMIYNTNTGVSNYKIYRRVTYFWNIYSDLINFIDGESSSSEVNFYMPTRAFYPHGV